MHPDSYKFYRTAYTLAVFTIVYNILEGIVSIYFGVSDESLSLFGFGADSFIEAVSGLGIAHMVLRIQKNPVGQRDRFEKTALRVTGFAFYALVAGLCASIIVNLLTAHRPDTTLAGVIISVVSIGVMLALIRAKTRVGRSLNSPAIIADAHCTTVCVYMSVVLLIASAAYELTGTAYVDDLGAAALAFFSFREGRECFRQSRNDDHCGCGDEATDSETR
ncbi:MAG TPA: cation transporter [Bacteroidota bacterium]|nr:cation transporter [Bacteroidota bacterium]